MAYSGGAVDGGAMGSGSFRLFRIAGIEVFLHFSWFLIAAYQLTSRQHGYRSPFWAVYEYIALFGIVLLHEFGHALACRQTGGSADRIMLWPLGGIAFVSPPPRPGAHLWSIAAGPLVNLLLVPVFEIVRLIADQTGWSSDAYRLVIMMRYINLALLIFNLLPIYPLDGGQLLRALLWFPFGPIRSLQVATVIGFAGGAAIGVYALWAGSIWIGILAFFLLTQAGAGWRQAQALTVEAEETRRLREEAERRPVF